MLTEVVLERARGAASGLPLYFLWTAGSTEIDMEMNTLNTKQFPVRNQFLSFVSCFAVTCELLM